MGTQTIQSAIRHGATLIGIVVLAGVWQALPRATAAIVTGLIAVAAFSWWQRGSFASLLAWKRGGSPAAPPVTSRTLAQRNAPGHDGLTISVAVPTSPIAPRVQAPGSDDPTAAPPLVSALPLALDNALVRIPRLVTSEDIRPYPESTTAVPLGLDEYKHAHWIDFAKGTYHVGLYAATRGGKDTLLRSWFLWLCRRNEPEDVQFAILDMKGDWMTNNLKDLAHMWIEPAGGYGDRGGLLVQAAIKKIDAEFERRYELIIQSNYRTRERYVAKTGKPLPLLFVVVTDAIDMPPAVEELLTRLVSKAAALGGRIIASMQTPTGKDMTWRMNLSTVLAGCMTDASQDGPALGLRKSADIRYRPSQLPAPGARPGVFVVRDGTDQFVVQAPYVPEDQFDDVVAVLPKRQVAACQSGVAQDDPLLSGLLQAPVTRNAPLQLAPPRVAASQSAVTNEAPVTATTPTPAEIAFISAQLAAGVTPSQAAKKIPGYDPREYQAFKAKVEYVQALLA